MKFIIKILSVFFILFISLELTGTENIKASENLTVKIKADETVRPDKSFDVFVEFYCDEGIGALQSSLTYDISRLSLSSVQLENKTSYDFFSYSDTSEGVKILVSNAKEKPVIHTVKFRFKPKDHYDDCIYKFSISFCSFCTDKKELIQCSSLPSFSVRSFLSNDTKTNSSSDDNSKTKNSLIYEKASELYQNNTYSQNDIKKAENGNYLIADYDNISGVSENTSSDSKNDNAYYIQEKISSFVTDKTFLLGFIGVVIIVSLAIIYAYKSGLKRAKRQDNQKK